MRAVRNPKRCRGAALSVVPGTRVGARQEGRSQPEMIAADCSPLAELLKAAWLLSESLAARERFCGGALFAVGRQRLNWTGAGQSWHDRRNENLHILHARLHLVEWPDVRHAAVDRALRR